MPRRAQLADVGLRYRDFDGKGQVRVLERFAQPFFAGTLSQPDRSARAEQPPSLVESLVRAAAAWRS
jgi:CTP synthase (UTP-ammonia lyase)